MSYTALNKSSVLRELVPYSLKQEVGVLQEFSVLRNLL